MATKVIYRRWKSGGYIALFPALAGNMNWDTCLSYETVGQHGTAGYYGVMAQTVPATAAEAAAMEAELKRVGYTDLVTVKRETKADVQERVKQIRP